MKTILVFCLIAAAFICIAGCTQPATESQPVATPAPIVTTSTTPSTATTTASVSSNTVVIQKMAFNPVQITVSPGSIVRWVNEDTVAHSVVFSPDAKIDSFLLGNSQSYSVKFTNPGIYNYTDGVYPQVQGGSVIVTQS